MDYNPIVALKNTWHGLYPGGDLARMQAGHPPLDMVVPRLPSDWKALRDASTGRQVWACLFLAVAMGAVAGTWWIWPAVWVGVAAMVIGSCWAIWMDVTSSKTHKLVEHHILASVQEDDLIVLEAVGQLSGDPAIQEESRAARQTLMNHRPGWSLAPSRPTWEALCPSRCES